MNNDEKDIRQIMLNLDDKECETLLIKLIVGLVMSAENNEEGMKRYSRVINAIGSAIAHSTTLQREHDSDENMHDESVWVTSPKDLVSFLLDSDALLDKEYLANSYKEFCLVQQLDSMFELPDADER